MQLDLGSLKSVRSFAETFLRTEPRLDLLINNAGEQGGKGGRGQRSRDRLFVSQGCTCRAARRTGWG